MLMSNAEDGFMRGQAPTGQWASEASVGPTAAREDESGSRAGGRDCSRARPVAARARAVDRRRRSPLAVSLVLAFAAGPAAADPPRPIADLDGLYLWLGPAGAATYQEGVWESTWGGSAAVLRIRERAPLGAVGATVAAAHYAGSDGGRLWLDGVVGTRLAGRMVGLAGGPALELGADHHPRWGASVALWAFVGLTPMLRLGALDERGVFVEVGAHLTLPVRRW
jgi:hypothetical protein